MVNPVVILLSALSHIASYDEGREVTESFDEPISARDARKALQRYEAAINETRPDAQFEGHKQEPGMKRD